MNIRFCWAIRATQVRHYPFTFKTIILVIMVTTPNQFRIAMPTVHCQSKLPGNDRQPVLSIKRKANRVFTIPVELRSPEGHEVKPEVHDSLAALFPVSVFIVSAVYVFVELVALPAPPAKH